MRTYPNRYRLLPRKLPRPYWLAWLGGVYVRVLWLQRKVNVVGVGVGVNRGMAEGKRRSARSLEKKL